MTTGSAALMLEGAETLIADSAAFRTRVGAANAEAAMLKIFYAEAEAIDKLQVGMTLADKRPFVILAIDAHGYIQIGQGARITLGGTGGVVAIFSDKPKYPDNYKQSYLDFLDWISTVMDEVAGDVGRDTAWPFNSIELAHEPWRPSITDRASDDFWLGGYVLSHHINGG